MKKFYLLIILLAICACGQSDKKIITNKDTLIFPLSLLTDTAIINLPFSEVKAHLPDSVSNSLSSAGKFEYVYSSNEYNLTIRYYKYKKTKPELDLIYIRLPQKSKEYLDTLVSKVAKKLDKKLTVGNGANFYRVELKPTKKFTTTFKITWMLDEEPEFYTIDINMANDKMYAKLPD